MPSSPSRAQGKTARHPGRPASVGAGCRGDTRNVDVASTLALFWGVAPVVTPEREVEALERFLVERQLRPPGSTVVFINVSPDLDRTDANFLNVQRVS